MFMKSHDEASFSIYLPNTLKLETVAMHKYVKKKSILEFSSHMINHKKRTIGKIMVQYIFIKIVFLHKP